MKKIEKNFNNSNLIVLLNTNEVLRINILRGILGGFAFFAMFYLFLLGSSVLNVVERKALESEAHILANTIGQLELDYLQVASSIDPNLSSSMGFEEISQNFATRKSFTLLSKKLAKNEI